MKFSPYNSLGERGGSWEEKGRVERYDYCGREEEGDGPSERESAC